MCLTHGRHPKSPLILQLPNKSVRNPSADDLAAQMCALIARAKLSIIAAHKGKSVTMTLPKLTSSLLLETDYDFPLQIWH